MCVGVGVRVVGVRVYLMCWLCGFCVCRRVPVLEIGLSLVGSGMCISGRLVGVVFVSVCCLC